MRRWKKAVSAGLLTVLMTALCLAGLGPFTETAHAATPLKVVPAPEWTDLFSRTSGWTGADGIYSIPMNGADQIGSATSGTKTFWTFADTFLGSVNTSNLAYTSLTMKNHSAAVLTGNAPTAANMSFKYGYQGDMTYTNIYNDNVWPQDGIAIGSNIYLTAYAVNAAMKPTRVDMIRIPIVSGNPDLIGYAKTNNIPLLYSDADHQILFGGAILDNTTTAGAPNPDGYVYIYGYRDALATSTKELVVARVLRNDFADTSKWRYYNNGNWDPNITYTNNPWAVLAGNISAEFSVTPINSGIYNGKYMLVYMRDTLSGTLEYRIGDSPYGPFGAAVPFYTAPEPSYYPSGTYTYNAKAHPHLSAAGELLISYNVNLWGAFPATNEIYRPRFVKLKLNEYATTPPARPAQTNVALGKAATASHINAQAPRAVDGNWSNIYNDKWSGSGTGDKWLKVDLGATYSITRWVVRHASAAGEPTAWNTRDFKLQRSSDGTTWYDVDAVQYNAAPVTDRDVAAFSARYVRLYITKPTQTGCTDTAARIYEFEVYKNN